MIVIDNPAMQDVLKRFYQEYLDINAPYIRQAKTIINIIKCKTCAYGADISRLGNDGLRYYQIVSGLYSSLKCCFVL